METRASGELRSYADRCLADHRELLLILAALHDLAAGGPASYMEWRIEVAVRLDELSRRTGEHFAAEEADFYPSFLARFPRFGGALRELRQEHATFLGRILDLRRACEQPSPGGRQDTAARLRELIAGLRRHEREETALLQRTYLEDVGSIG
jgi:hypothetical protein